MHPAPSIIFFTVLSGLGYGLAALLGLGLFDPTAIATKAAYILSLGLIAGGLVSSTLHLGNPQRAWRAFSQWRSSWLSREGVMAVLTFLPLACSAIATLWFGQYLVLPGLLGAALCGVTVFCTAMIYASLKSIDAWHTPLTPLCYLLFAGAGGSVAGVFFAALGGGDLTIASVLAIVLTAVSWIAKLTWRSRMKSRRPLSTPETATGLGAIGKVRLFERPHVNDNYLTREMGFRVARKHAQKLATIALLLGGAVPFVTSLVLLISVTQPGAGAAVVALLGLISYLVGMLVERWLFFAEARHAVMNYYGG